jgi:arsenate reductase
MVKRFIEKIKGNLTHISEERAGALDALATLIREDLQKGESVVKFICTHNSRRSQTAEFMLDILAKHYNLNITALSAGTEATAFAPSMVSALQNEGFELMEYGQQPNPLYIYRRDNNDLYYYSKKYDEQLMDYGDAIIVTVCGDAHENCPVIPGTLKRFHLGYIDPKKSDGTPQEAETYTNKVLEIGTEMLYLAQTIIEVD